MPEHAQLVAEPSMKQVKEAMGNLADSKAIGIDKLFVHLFKTGITDHSVGLNVLHKIVATVWREEAAPQEWKDTAIKLLFMKKVARKCGKKHRRIWQGPHVG